ncbi:transcription regulator [Cadophora sp. MPI-SDFR-AT-0126]|nr:transcription regulator [Leotiomycetes sp. MPI-SDFR-AT-0126]
MSPPTASNKLSTHLLTLHPQAFTSATQTPFLSHAGAGTLPKDVLQKWLAQDRLYAQAYIRFAALLLANVRLSGRVDGDAFEERLLDLILSSITNVRRELKFFEEVATRYDLDISSSSSSSISKGDGDEGISKGVILYRKLFFEVGEEVEARRMGMLEGLVLLWGTEVCYLTAWRYAASCSPQGSSTASGSEADGGALRKEFIPNWTSDEFAAFVDEIKGFLDALWEMEGEGEGERAGEKRERVEGIWKRVLDVERVFWPVVE